MGIFTIEIGKLKLPVFDLATLGAGFYVGYQEGKGHDMSNTSEFLTKYAPTVAAVTLTPLHIRGISAFGKWFSNGVESQIKDGSLRVITSNGRNRIDTLEAEERQKLEEKVNEAIAKTREKMDNLEYVRPTVKMGLRTAIESTAGYVAGRLYSQFG